MKGITRGRLQISGSVVVIDQERMDQALAEKKIQVPIGLTRKQKREFILEASKKYGNDTSK